MKPPLPVHEIEGWFFDLDGTLMDTDDQTVERLAQRLSFIGAQRAERLARRAVMFSETPLNNLITALDVVGLDPPLFFLSQLLGSRKSPLFPIIDGVDELLRYLEARATLAVVTTRSREAASTFLEQHHLRERFDALVTRESTRRLKPHPAPILYAASQLGLTPERCAMVGDTPADVRSARRAGAWAVGVLCGFGEEPELKRAGAHVILPCISDLLPLFKTTMEPSEPETKGAA
jgi:HAD superfamily hydrolase (TIGR01509 family)